MASELEMVRERIKVMKEVKRIEQEKLNKIPLKDRKRELEQRLVVRDIEKEIRELEEKEFAIVAANGLLEYIKQTQKIEMEHINNIKI